jgi:hypothetical protein
MDDVPDLDLPAEDEFRALFDGTLAELSQVALRLAHDLERYRQLMAPMLAEASLRVSGTESALVNMHLLRQLTADAATSQEAMRTCVRHASLAYDAALQLRRSLEHPPFEGAAHGRQKPPCP